MLTDHKNLTFIVDSQSERVIRYKMALQAFDINWVHAHDKSRAPTVINNITISNYTPLTTFSLTKIWMQSVSILVVFKEIDLIL